MSDSMMDIPAITLLAIGGLGIFLLGMIVMTDGLKSLAGEALQRNLMRFTRSPSSGVVTGALSTALLQSSSATTVAAVGFVGAGLMTFPSALGIIFGANVGTTITGWMVALLGFNLQLGTLLLPVILLGTLLRLFGHGHWSNGGYAVAGFGLIFVGIEMMQSGMSGLSHLFTLSQFPADSLSSRLVLVGIGILFTLVTQSSSAGVAMALSALFSGFIDFPQAAALVIGMDIGTTITAALATIGASTEARRTGFSHVIYNLLTATGALLLLSPYIWLWESLSPGLIYSQAEIALVAFHTTFNLLGVVLVLPFTQHFARLMQQLVRERGIHFSHELDQALLAQPKIALPLSQQVIQQELLTMLHHLASLLDSQTPPPTLNLYQMQIELDQTHAYLDQIHLQSTDGGEWLQLVALMHILDHLQRLHERCEEEAYRPIKTRSNRDLRTHCEQLALTVSETINDLNQQKWHQAQQRTEKMVEAIQTMVSPCRREVMIKIASGELTVSQGTVSLDAIRWLQRVSQHIAKLTEHLEAAIIATAETGSRD